MIVKIVSIFLIGMLVLAMFGRFRITGLTRKKARKCPKCGAPVIGRGPCVCGKGKS